MERTVSDGEEVDRWDALYDGGKQLVVGLFIVVNILNLVAIVDGRFDHEGIRWVLLDSEAPDGAPGLLDDLVRGVDEALMESPMLPRFVPGTPGRLDVGAHRGTVRREGELHILWSSRPKGEHAASRCPTDGRSLAAARAGYHEPRS